MTRRHWDAVELLARVVGSTPSGVLCALVEQAVNEAAERVEAIDAGEGQE
jgi:hypothetical protein